MFHRRQVRVLQLLAQWWGELVCNLCDLQYENDTEARHFSVQEAWHAPPPPPTAHYALLLQVPRACNPSDVEHCFGLFSFLGLCHCLSQRCSELLCTHNKSACLHVPL